ncbi:alpha N-terminal protein methyltransferase 1-like [Musca domestica]|uniref:Alpha N-terminal protein methyltransferase 1 n=1 Tax=Musca domestica TaxID=7370 RepID=A0A1I8MMV9_MUSDO|nr:alpha N-terminal protein methyltransferase 1-like [Musca domestica]
MEEPQDSHAQDVTKTAGEENCTDAKQEFYIKAQKYWSEVPPTVNGMLGGLGYINAVDIQASTSFLRELKIKDMHKKYALDCGAGIGRVTKNLLMPLFEKVDLVEQDPAFAEKARDYCVTDMGSTLGYPKRLGEIYNVGLQEFIPTPQKYDVVWSQWVLGHLTDEDLLKFFKRVKVGLAEGGLFVMKENVSSSNSTVLDDTDSSVTRPLTEYEKFLEEAGYRIIKITKQKNFPKGLFPVCMIACRPMAPKINQG